MHDRLTMDSTMSTNYSLEENLTKINQEYDDYDQKPARTVYNEPRHFETIEGLRDLPNQNWRSKERMKTMSVAIVLCLNVGIDPPDVVKPNPCAVLQCWTDPFDQSTQTKTVDTIAANLVKQYERWQPRARYKHCTDPTIEDIKKLCNTLRRASKEERVLFHYNGHGVPKPTVNGEIWVFNRSYTQYIPLSLYDLQQWMGSPSIYVFDCSNAGVIVDQFKQYAIQHQKEFEMNSSSYLNSSKDSDMLNGKLLPPPNYQNCILLAACDKGETIPLHPDLPADLFTSCLTTPIKTFIVWFMKRNAPKFAPDINIDMIDKIPGSLADRKSIMGELNWIFTAITDTIAWNMLPRDLFQKLFRQDLLVASLFRNFLLAQRIMRSYDCTPVSNPPIKSAHHHPMWNAWDLAVDSCLSQLVKIGLNSKTQHIQLNNYVPSQFFTEQLTAFQVWLKLSPYPTSIPEQLPIVLQVLLSQVHRSRALDLLGNFLNLGPWAVNLALSVGIFPYVLKLLQASARELRPFLVFIWAKILAIDESYQSELIRDNAHRYFMNILSDSNISTNHQIMAAFVLSVIVRHNPTAQNIVTLNHKAQGNAVGGQQQSESIFDIGLSFLMDPQIDHPGLKKWLLICFANVWENNEDVRWLATRNAIYEELYPLLEDPVPEVRAATVCALGTFINSISQRNEHANEVDCRIVSTLVQKTFYDGSPLVRKELLVTLHWFITIFENMFLATYRKRAFEEHTKKQKPIVQEMKQMEFGGSSPKNHASNQYCIPSLIANQTNEITNYINGGSPTNNGMLRKTTSRDRLSNAWQTQSSNKLLTVPMSITSPSLSNAHQSNANLSQQQLTPPKMKRVSSVSSIQSYGNSSAGFLNSGTTTAATVFGRVWQVIELCLVDPYPEVAEMASLIFHDIGSKAFIRALKEVKDMQTTSSKSGSPSNQEHSESYHRHRQESPSSESQILDSCESYKSSSQTLTTNRGAPKHHSGRVSVSGTSSPYLPNSSNYNSFVTQYATKRSMLMRDTTATMAEEMTETIGRQHNGIISNRGDRNDLSESSSFSESSQVCRKPLVQTSYIDWCTKHFCEPCSHSGSSVCGCTNIEMSQNDLVGEWRFQLLKRYYQKSRKELIDSPIIQNGQELVKRHRSIDANFSVFHPYEKCIVCAGSNHFSVWNYQTQPETEILTQFSNGGVTEIITDLHLINAHDKALIMLASDDGAVKIWRDVLPTTFANISVNDTKYSIEPKLSSAFFMFEDIPIRSPERSRNLILSWNQRTQNIIAGGDHRLIRLWDATKEMKIRDIMTGSDTIASLSTDGNHLICVGCDDGVIRIFDDRQRSNSSQVYSINDRNGAILNAKIWPENQSDSINIVAGKRSGQVCWYDQRFTCKAVRVESMNAQMTAMSFHDNTPIFACAFGYDNSELQLYTLDTLKGPITKFRNRSIRNISFHSLKVFV
ncbi:hypothetical protein RDWZM_006691 [Blomia tropicalis]|uniref:Raptor N-terminal CASPase-like domain-containing protein n=1 Tax=Blomia tropicalis TaxID=40697 RepID=A0A9Q0M8R4_BLOTA|nr:hypothetical protein RDWZM_006691 [Blomia tropicalis]